MPRYRVFLLEPDTGVILNPNGTRYFSPPQKQPFAPYFDTWDAALQTKDELLRAVPWACVEIFDFVTSKGQVFWDEAGHARHAQMRAALSRWRRLPFFLRPFFKRPPDPFVIADDSA